MVEPLKRETLLDKKMFLSNRGVGLRPAIFRRNPHFLDIEKCPLQCGVHLMWCPSQEILLVQINHHST